MPYHPNPTNVQIDLIQDAMKNAGVWSEKIPIWVNNYQHNQIPDVWEWLQFIYLPMRLNGTISEPRYIAPILSPFLNAEPRYREILQLVIELDAISPTYHP